MTEFDYREMVLPNSKSRADAGSFPCDCGARDKLGLAQVLVDQLFDENTSLRKVSEEQSCTIDYQISEISSLKSGIDEAYNEQLLKNKALYDQSLMDIENEFRAAVIDITQQQSKILGYITVGLVAATVCINTFVLIFSTLSVS